MRVGLFIIPSFGLISYSAVVESLFQVQQHLPRGTLLWETIGSSAGLVTSSSGVQIKVDATIADANQYDWVIVIGSRGASTFKDPSVMAWLRRSDRSGVRMGGVTSGTWVLARAGLLKGYRCTVHWRELEAFRETYPELDASENIYVVDRSRFTCGGGEATVDMMLYMLSHEFGPAITRKARETLIHTKLRQPSERQRLELHSRLGTRNPHVTAAISLLDRTLTESMPMDRLSAAVGVSQRRLEQLFRTHLGKTPKQYQLEMKLSRARELLLTTGLAIREVALIVGFENPAHFSTIFKKFHGASPLQVRRSVPSH